MAQLWSLHFPRSDRLIRPPESALDEKTGCTTTGIGTTTRRVGDLSQMILSGWSAKSTCASTRRNQWI